MHMEGIWFLDFLADTRSRSLVSFFHNQGLMSSLQTAKQVFSDTCILTSIASVDISILSGFLSFMTKSRIPLLKIGRSCCSVWKWIINSMCCEYWCSSHFSYLRRRDRDLLSFLTKFARRTTGANESPRRNVQDQMLNSQVTTAQHVEREKAYDIIASLLKIPFLDEEVVNSSHPRKMGRVDVLTQQNNKKDIVFPWTDVFQKSQSSKTSMAPVFGNGLSTACVVNIGAQVTSVICVEVILIYFLSLQNLQGVPLELTSHPEEMCKIRC